MQTLIVLAHPLRDSFCAALARIVEETAAARGDRVDFIDLYADDFDPRLTAAERIAYFEPDYDTAAVRDYTDRLRHASNLVLVFPQWWFGMPAILKGFIDRIFVPGVAFDAAPAPGSFIPRLDRLRTLWAITTVGSPWWRTRLYAGDPVRRELARAVVPFCAPSCRFRMLTCYDMDRATAETRHAFIGKLTRAMARS